MEKVRTKDDLARYYEKALKYMVSDTDFQRWLGQEARDKVIRYSDLQRYSSIQELLPEQKDYRIVLTEWKRNVGHWCCLLRYGDVIEWFDSYGTAPDGELRFVPERMKHILGEDRRILSALLKKAKEEGFTVIYNRKKLQHEGDVSTCGRWTLSRIVTMKLGYDLDDYLKLIDKQVKGGGKPTDIVVIDLIPMPQE